MSRLLLDTTFLIGAARFGEELDGLIDDDDVSPSPPSLSQSSG
jgi:hypothetical protein